MIDNVESAFTLRRVTVEDLTGRYDMNPVGKFDNICKLEHIPC